MAFHHREEPVLIALVAIFLALTLPAYQKVVAAIEANGVDLPLWKHLLIFVSTGVIAVLFLWLLCFAIGVVIETIIWIVSRFRKR